MEGIFRMIELISFIILLLLLRFVFRTTKFFIKIAIIIYILVMMLKYGEVFFSR